MPLTDKQLLGIIDGPNVREAFVTIFGDNLTKQRKDLLEDLFNVRLTEISKRYVHSSITNVDITATGEGFVLGEVIRVRNDISIPDIYRLATMVGSKYTIVNIEYVLKGNSPSFGLSFIAGQDEYFAKVATGSIVGLRFCEKVT